ncbi:hypothetical protein JVT61DRAFT_15053 [Boletus reticuloceps]|uniref:Uncharacterized protein n=1 Tax=Boletus reticuloceps TaxID=495285 RepID=A0A8I3ACF9_9AGAM|nr:hypothetical protein JVT61DRAFT_15053 [Boletus reticuloceps]
MLRDGHFDPLDPEASIDVGPPSVRAGTPTDGYSAFSEADPKDSTQTVQYHSITAIPAYRDTSLEELRMQDYQRGREAETAGVSRTLGQQQPATHNMSDPRLVEELLRMSLFGKELVDTEFHIFSARSSGRVMKPRALLANNALLAKNSKYFLDLLNSDMDPSDSSLVEFIGDDDVFGSAPIDDYGYETDSDLDDYDDPIPVAIAKPSKSRSATLSTFHSQCDDEKLPETGSVSVSPDMSIINPEQTREDELSLQAVHRDGATEADDITWQDSGIKTSLIQVATPSVRRIRRILVRDTAFQSWYTLLHYLYTDKVSFLPLTSATPGRKPLKRASTSFLDEPRCSAKSMYRLASKVGLDRLRHEALTHIWRNLTEHNIIREISCDLVSRYPELLEKELDVLYSHIASPAVVAGFPELSRRIANKELPHGAAIIAGIHVRILSEPQRFKPSDQAGSSGGTVTGHDASDEAEDEDEDE